MKHIIAILCTLALVCSSAWAQSFNVVQGGKALNITDGSDAVSYGYFGVKTTADFNVQTPDKIHLYKVTNSQNGATIPSLGMNLQSATCANVVLVLYDSTGNLLCYTGEISGSQGYVEGNVTTPALINAGTFWVGYWSKAGYGLYNESGTTADAQVVYDYGYDANLHIPPATIDVSSPALSYRRSLYANYTY